MIGRKKLANALNTSTEILHVLETIIAKEMIENRDGKSETHALLRVRAEAKAKKMARRAVSMMPDSLKTDWEKTI